MNKYETIPHHTSKSYLEHALHVFTHEHYMAIYEIKVNLFSKYIEYNIGNIEVVGDLDKSTQIYLTLIFAAMEGEI